MLPTATAFDKRVVLRIGRGRRKDLHQIMGLESEARAKNAAALPEFVGPIQIDDHVGLASLVAVKRSYVLFRETFSPDPKTFHPEQR